MLEFYQMIMYAADMAGGENGGEDQLNHWETRVESGLPTPAIGKDGEKGFVKKERNLYFFWSGMSAVVYGTIDFLRKQTQRAIEAALKKKTS